MKNIITRLLILAVLSGLPVAQATDDTAPDSYAQAVAAYVTAADQQLHAIRSQVEAGTKNASESLKGKYAGVFGELGRLEKSLEVLKTAKQQDFDRLKAAFEHTRDAMIRQLEDMRRTG